MANPSWYMQYRDRISRAEKQSQREAVLRAAEADRRITEYQLAKLKRHADKCAGRDLSDYCTKSKCIYWKKPGAGVNHSCNYISLTGKSRIAQIPDRKLRHDFARCPLFEKKAPPPPRPLDETRTRYDWRRGMTLYAAGATDAEIAQELGCKPQTVAWWRSRMRLVPNRKRGHT